MEQSKSQFTTGSLSLSSLMVILLFGSISLATQANSLPTEIDYISSEQNYLLSKEASDELERQKDEADQVLTQMEQRRVEMESNYESLVDEYYQNQARMDSLDRDNRNRQRRIDVEHQTIQGRLGQVSRHERQANRLAPQHQQAKRELDQQVRRLNQLTRQLGTAREQRNTHKRDYERNKNRLEGLNENLEKAEGELREKNEKKSQLEKRVARAQTRQEELESEQRPLRRQVNQLQREIDRLERQLENLRNSRGDGNERRIAELERQVRAKKNEGSELRQEIQKLQEQIKNLNESSDTWSAQIEQLNEEIQSGRRGLVKLRENIENREKEVEQVRDRLQNAERIVTQRQRDVSRQNSSVESAQNEVQRLERELDHHQTIISELRRENENSRSIIDNEQRRIYEQEEAIARLSQRAPQIQRSLNNLEHELNRLQADISSQTDWLADVTQEWEEALTQTQRDLATYEQRRELYLHYEKQASDMGGDQAVALARDLGENQGGQDYLEQAESNASAMGEIRGKLDGQLRGLVDGRDEGDGQGYSDGLASEGDYQEGYDSGFVAGERDAVSEARSTFLPQRYRQVFNQLLAKLPGEMAKNSHKRLEGQLKSLSTNVAGEDVKNGMDLEQLIRKVMEQVRTYENPVHNLSEAEYAYRVPRNIQVDTSARQCSRVYRSLAIFQEVCQQAYASSFRDHYKSEHRAIYFDRYADQYAETFSRVFPQFEDRLYRESFDQAYEEAYNRSLIRGKEEIREEGFQDGLADGYKAKFPEARAQALAEGESRAHKFFAENEVVRSQARFSDEVVVADISAAQMLQGRDFKLSLKMANFGEQRSTKGRAILEASVERGNVSIVGPSRLPLPSIKGSEQVLLEDLIQVRISEAARPGESFTVRFNLTYPGDDFASSHSETLVFQGKVVENPEFRSALRYEKKPQWRRLIFFYPKHDVEVELQGLHAGLTGDYRVELVPVSSNDAKMIDLETSSVNVGRLSRGQTKRAILVYQFNKEARNATVRMKVRYYYRNKVIKENLIVVHPD